MNRVRCKVRDFGSLLVSLVASSGGVLLVDGFMAIADRAAKHQDQRSRFSRHYALRISLAIRSLVGTTQISPNQHVISRNSGASVFFSWKKSALTGVGARGRIC